MVFDEDEEFYNDFEESENDNKGKFCPYCGMTSNSPIYKTCPYCGMPYIN